MENIKCATKAIQEMQNFVFFNKPMVCVFVYLYYIKLHSLMLHFCSICICNISLFCFFSKYIVQLFGWFVFCFCCKHKWFRYVTVWKLYECIVCIFISLYVQQRVLRINGYAESGIFKKCV